MAKRWLTKKRATELEAVRARASHLMEQARAVAYLLDRIEVVRMGIDQEDYMAGTNRDYWEHTAAQIESELDDTLAALSEAVADWDRPAPTDQAEEGGEDG